MSVSYTQAQKQRYRITLDLEVLGDFNPHQIDWEELFNLEGNERVESYIEDLNNPTSWWHLPYFVWNISVSVPVRLPAHDIGVGAKIVYCMFIGGGSHSTLR